MKININGMHYDEIFFIVNKLEKLKLKTKIDVFGSETILSTEINEEHFEKIVELDEDNSEIIEIDSIAF